MVPKGIYSPSDLHVLPAANLHCFVVWFARLLTGEKTDLKAFLMLQHFTVHAEARGSTKDLSAGNEY